MNNPRIPKFLLRASLPLALALALWSPALAQSPEPAGGKMTMEGKGKMMERCQEMKEHKQKMMAEMKTEDAELTAQVAAMNSASESNKPGLMAAIVTRMLEQRIARDEHKAKMEEEMMQHMMQHMQNKDDMSACPMMKGMDGMDDKSPDAHKEHHEMEKK